VAAEVYLPFLEANAAARARVDADLPAAAREALVRG
jgi:hypothetical protein